MSDGIVQLKVARPAPEQVVPAAGAPRLYVETYGCQMNVADSDMVAGMFLADGYARAEGPGDADVILVNTCAVREKAEEKVFARVAELKVHKRRRGAVLGITGCMAEHLKEKVLEAAPWVDVVAGPDSYRRLGALVASARAGAEAALDVRLDKGETYEGIDAAPGGDGVSGFVTIQRGCDKFCTFCVVPFTRGRERGTPPREVLRQVRGLAEAGYKEVTLLGQTVNSYRWEEARFSDLLRAVAAVPGIERVRFTSPYPIDFTADVIAAIAKERRICPHIHLPLQSGSDAVLERMKRGYDYAAFVDVVRALREGLPRVAITTDILVGFSGETDEDHALTLAAMDELRFDNAFMFAYSERDLTAAARRLPDDVSPELKQRRLTDVIKKQEKIAAEINASYVGGVERVLLHHPSKRSADQLVGRTDTFKAVIVDRGPHAPGDVVTVRIDRSTGATLFGTIV